MMFGQESDLVFLLWVFIMCSPVFEEKQMAVLVIITIYVIRYFKAIKGSVLCVTLLVM